MKEGVQSEETLLKADDQPARTAPGRKAGLQLLPRRNLPGLQRLGRHPGMLKAAARNRSSGTHNL